MSTPKKVQRRRVFLEKYGTGPRSYFRREGAIVMACITILIIGAGAFALSGVSLNIGYLFLLAFIALAIAFVGTYISYHYQITQARKTMASVREIGFHNPFDNTHLDRSWNDASIYVPPPVAAVTRS